MSHISVTALFVAEVIGSSEESHKFPKGKVFQSEFGIIVEDPLNMYLSLKSLFVGLACIAPSSFAQAIGSDYVMELNATFYESEVMSPQNMDYDRENKQVSNSHTVIFVVV